MLKTYKRTTWRGIMGELLCSAKLRDAWALETVPHWTTLQKFAARPEVIEVAGQMLVTILAAAIKYQREAEPTLFLATAMDVTGLESSSFRRTASAVLEKQGKGSSRCGC